MNTVDALDSPHHIQLVHDFLAKNYNPIVVDAWDLGLQLAYRVTDLLALKFEHVVTRDGRHVVSSKDGKTGKSNVTTINTKGLAIIERRRADNPNDVYVLQSQANNRSKLGPRPISRGYLCNAFKEAGRIPEIDRPLGTHTMRKTRGLAIYRHYGNDIARAAQALNHSNTSSTMRYLGLTAASKAETFDLIL